MQKEINKLIEDLEQFTTFGFSDYIKNDIIEGAKNIKCNYDKCIRIYITVEEDFEIEEFYTLKEYLDNPEQALKDLEDNNLMLNVEIIQNENTSTDNVYVILEGGL